MKFELKITNLTIKAESGKAPEISIEGMEFNQEDDSDLLDQQEKPIHLPIETTTVEMKFRNAGRGKPSHIKDSDYEV